MTDNNDDLISSLYPPPPPYVRFFTAENVQKLEEWNGDKGKMDVDGAEPPGELKLLVPPKVPEGDHYRGYGNIWSFEDKIPSLLESGWKQLYNDDEETSQKKIEVLHKLKEALLLNFLELIGIVSIEPEQFNSKIEDLKILLINISHIINTYRPHQSRESLITMLRRQIDLKKSEISTIDRVMLDIKKEVLTSVNKSSSQLTDPEPIDEITVESPRTEILNKVLSSID